MKKYRLKQWYPSLKQDWSKGDIAEWFDGYYWNKGKVILNGLSKNEVENNPDFWELIEDEKPLFITEDGVEVYDIDFLVFAVKGDFLKIQTFALAFKQQKNDMKSFYHESNADEYIWKNKRVFSYNDMVTAKKSVVLDEEDIVRIAKERSKQ